MEIAAFQDVLRRTYAERDSDGGVDDTFPWLTDEVGEVGEVARALRGDGDLEHEVGDVLAWVPSLASLVGVDLEEAASRYANGCPKCGAIPSGARRLQWAPTLPRQCCAARIMAMSDRFIQRSSGRCRIGGRGHQVDGPA